MLGFIDVRKIIDNTSNWITNRKEIKNVQLLLNEKLTEDDFYIKVYIKWYMYFIKKLENKIISQLDNYKNKLCDIKTHGMT